MKVCKRCNRSRKIYAKGVCKSCYNTLHPSKKMVICKMCNELKIHNGNGLCKSCYNKIRSQIPELKIIIKKQHADWRKNNHERVLDQGRKDDKKRAGSPKRLASKRTPKSLVNARKSDAKRRGSPKRLASKSKSQAKRKRKLGWIKMFKNPFDITEKVDWHHITDVYVVAIPKDIHQLLSGYKQEKHRELVMNVAKQIYLDK